MEKMTPLSEKTWWWLYAAAAVGLYTTLTLPYLGEEAVYTITSLEMRLNENPFVTTLYGTNYGRPPLLNWLMIPLTEVLGWERVLLSSRLIAATATVVTALVLAWLAYHLTRERVLAASSAALYLSGDVLFYRGWLAYADPLFTLFVFGGIACLWVALLRTRPVLLWPAVLLVSCGFLAKVQTAFLFYGTALAVLALDRDHRKVLLGAQSLAAHAAAAAALIALNMVFAKGSYSGGTVTDIVLKVKTADLGDYLKQLVTFPLETVLRFAPVSMLALYYLWRKRGSAGAPVTPEFPWRTLLAILALGYLPYWLGPKTHIRYIMPLYPLAALALTAALWRLGERPLRMAVRWLIAAIVLRYALGLVLFPLYQQQHRGDYAATAARITETTRGFPLYATDVSSTGLIVTALLDQQRFPQPYLRWPEPDWNDGFVLSYTPDPQKGQLSASYKHGGNTLYLLCRGTACATRR